MNFSLGKHLRFIDSFQFMSSSLDKLVKNLSDEAYKTRVQCRGVHIDEKKRVFILMTSWTVLERLIKENCLKRGFLQFVEQSEYQKVLEKQIINILKSLIKANHQNILRI